MRGRDTREKMRYKKIRLRKIGCMSEERGEAREKERGEISTHTHTHTHTW